MKIISWNVNGLRAVYRKGLFMPFIEKHKPDILCLQEIKSQKEQNELDLSEYKEYWNPATKPGYSGTAIFTKETPLLIQFNIPEKISNKYELSEDIYGDLNTEGRVIMAEFNDFYIVNVYTPNSKEDLSRLELRHKRWDTAFLEYIHTLEKKKPVIFCGDLNVAHTEDDLANPKQNVGKHGFTSEEREGIDNIIKSGYIDSFRNFTQGNGHYSWWTHWANSRERNVGWRIDYFFVSNKLKQNLKSASILSDVFGSDHCPVEVVIDLSTT